MHDSILWWTGALVWFAGTIFVMCALSALVWHGMLTSIFVARLWRDAARAFKRTGDPAEAPKWRRLPGVWLDYFLCPADHVVRGSSVIYWPGKARADD